MNAREGIKTVPIRDVTSSRINELKTMNAREGIKTDCGCGQNRSDFNFGQLKTMNAREGIKTSGWFGGLFIFASVKNNECP